MGYSKLKLLEVISYQTSLGYVQEISVKDMVENKAIKREAREPEPIIYLDNEVTKTSKRSSARESANEPGAIFKEREVNPYLTAMRRNRGGIFPHYRNNNMAAGKKSARMRKNQNPCTLLGD